MAIDERIEIKQQARGAGYSKVLLAFVLGVIVGSVAVWFIIGSTALSPVIPFDPSDLVGGDRGADKISKEYITVEDQLAGDRVLIKDILLSDSSWAVVHEDVDGVPGNALGAQRFDEGLHSGTIDLLRSTQVGQNYYILLYKDDGDREFNLETDVLITDSKGDSIKGTFQIIRIDRKIN